MDHAMLVIFSITSGLSFCVLFRIPRRFIIANVLLAVFASMSLRLSAQKTGFETFFIAMGIGILSHLLARKTQSPAQGFLIPGVMFLVPGDAVYQTISAIIESNPDLAFNRGLKAMLTTLSISFALLVVNWVMPPRQDL